MNNFKLNIKEILHLFDSDKGASNCSNPIKTMLGEELMFALLMKYFESIGRISSLLIHPVTQGGNKGVRLDGWIKVDKSNLDKNDFLYQVEVKTWSAHGVGLTARLLPINHNESELENYRRDMWGRYWRDGGFREKELQKVLIPMLPPKIYENLEVKPLACLWSPLHPSGDAEPFFVEKTMPSSHFPEVAIFSASSFLRQLDKIGPNLELILPRFSDRMGRLNRLFM